MKCPKCYTENPKGAKFCGECAEPLPTEIECPQCQHMNPKSQKFCNECARPLVESTKPLSRKQRSLKDRVAFCGVATLVLAFIAFEIAALILWAPGMWNERLSAFLAIIGMYGLAIAFISRSKGFKAMRDVMEDLTSSNIFRYMRGNCLFLSFLSGLISDALSPGKVPGYPLWHFPIAVPLLFLVSLLFFPYAASHLLVIAALAYIPMVLVSVFVDEFVYAGTESVFKFRSESEYETVWISGMVKGNPAAVKGFLLGIPALSISLLSAIISPFIA